ncbi:MAG TPA: discoidin domain-containing protein, partial [Thermoanaerobaculia bacterium]|nr:discoidin domain-containing protein [Thermoanaerobaculia bacterium]
LLAATPSPQVLDDFKDISRWKVLPSDGIEASISPAEGGLRLDYDFQGRGGYAVVRREIPLDLPENYEITFRIRGEGLPNTLEFKLVDPTQENVWWVTRRDFEPPREWTEIRFKKRHIQFAWGPKGGGEIRRVAAIELTVTAGRGGKGFVIFDDLTLTERPPDRPYDRTPRITSSAKSFTMDFLERREYGGLVVDWEPSRFASRYDVQISDDGQDWKTLRTVEGGNGGRDYLYLPETDSQYLRLLYHEGSGEPTVTVQPLEFSASKNAFFERIAKDAPRGRYPRATTGEQVYWTVVGADGDTAEGLFSEDGALETGKSAFSIEPFLFVDGKLLTWADVRASQSLAGGYLPIPSVLWESAPVSLEITTFATGEPGRSVLHARYRLRNTGQAEAKPKLFVAVRPFQVNPPYQFLNTPGGAAPIREIAWDGRAVSVDGRTVIPREAPSGFGAATFDEGDITDRLVRGELPTKNKVNDTFGHASAALAWDLRLAPGEQRDIHVTIPLHTAMTEGDLATVEREWREKLDRVGFRLPASVAPWAETLRSNLAYLLINRDGPGIQPGSRSYERSWIRDGALSSSAMLRLGHADAAREFLVWYAGHQFPNGKVPCCVDARGADPVPENDSHGEFIHLVAEHYRYTRDRELLASLLPNVQKAVLYMEGLR